MKKSKTKKIISAVSALATFAVVFGLFAAFPGISSPVLQASAENIYAETSENVVFDADYIKNMSKISSPHQTEHTFTTSSDGIPVLKLTAMPHSGSEDPYVSFKPAENYRAEDYKYITVLAKVPFDNKEIFVSKHTQFSIFYSVTPASGQSTNYVGNQNAAASYNVNTSEWQLLTFDFSADERWTGVIDGIRLDYFEGTGNPNAEKTCEIAAVALSKTPDDLYDLSFKMMTSIYPPVQILSDFKESELKYFERAEGFASNNTPWLPSLDSDLSLRENNLLYTFKYDDNVEHGGPDPYSGFFYDEFAEARGIKALSTEDFGYTVFRFRTSGDIGGANMQLYYFTGNGERVPTFIDGKEMAPSANYVASTANQWRCVAIDMTAGHSYKGWNGDFNGFRIDWCRPASVDAVASMEISDIMFFKDAAAANAVANALSRINVAIEITEAHSEDYENSVKVSDGCLIMLPEELDGKIENSDNSTHYISDNGGVEVIRIETSSETSAPFVTLKPNGINADEYKFITLAVRSNVASGAAMKLDFVTSNTKKGDKSYYVSRYAVNKDWQLITIPLDGYSSWSGEVKELKLNYLSYDPVYTGYAEGTFFDIAGIAFSKNIEAYYDSAYYLMAEVYRPTQVLSDFKESELGAFTKAKGATDTNLTKVLGNDTVLTISGDNLKLESAGNYHDPFISFYYHQLMNLRGVAEEDRVTTDDFCATVVRYRTSPKINGAAMQFFIFTGDKTGAFEVGDAGHFTATANYSATQFNTWRSMCLVMNGKKETASAWSGAFNGFRIDWAAHSPSVTATGNYMEISEFFFFKDAATAKKFTDLMNTLYYPTQREVSDEYATELPAPTDVLFVDADTLNSEFADTLNSVHYPINVNGVPAVRLETTDFGVSPYVIYYPNNVSADEYKYVTLLIRRTNASDKSLLLKYATDESLDIRSQYVSSSYSSDTKIYNEWQTVTFNLSGKESFKGVIDRLDICYLYNSTGVAEGAYCDIAGVAFSKTEEGVYDAAEYMLAKTYRSVQILTDFTDADAQIFGGAEASGSTQLSFEAGNVTYTATGQGDPQKLFNYLAYAESKGIKPVTTDAFRYTVIRYKAQGVVSSARNVELFIITGDANGLVDMVRNGDYGCHAGSASYINTNAWKSLVVDMAEDDGLKDNNGLRFGWNREDGNTTFKGFRMDWCSSGTVDSSLTVSDFLFFDSYDLATAFSAAINAVSIPAAVGDNGNPDIGGDPFEEESSLEDGGNTESIPEFENTTETNEPVNTESQETDSLETETTSESVKEEETTNDGGDRPSNPGIDPPAGGGSQGEGQKPGEGSQAPFYIACAALAALTVASLVSSGVIRAKLKKADGTDPEKPDPDGDGLVDESQKE